MKHFVEEARNLTRFKHRNIVGAMRFIRQNGTAYLVMEFCDGESLEAMARRLGVVAEHVARPVMDQLLDGLEEVHRSRLLHLDIKPSNIFIKKDGTVVLLDFGSARQAISSHTKSVKVASSGYAAIEQESVDIDSAKLGPWTDIYGLGATMYRLVTGERPPQATSRILQDTLKPIELSQPGQYSAGFREAIELSLRLRPLERPRSIQELRGLLSRATDTVEAEHLPSAEDAELGTQQGLPRWIWGGAAGLAVAVGLFVFGGVLKNSAVPTPEPTVDSEPVEIPTSRDTSPEDADPAPPVIVENKPAPRDVVTTKPETSKDRSGLPACSQSSPSYRDGCIGDFENEAVRYSGEWRFNRPEGQGELRYKKTGERYAGGIMNGMPHGRGESLFRDGTRYIGDFDQGIWKGRGILVESKFGARYVGDFVESRIVIGIKYSGDCKSVLFAGSFNEDFTSNTAYDLDTALYKCR